MQGRPEAIFFDLDGTLLSTDTPTLMRAYFEPLAARLAKSSGESEAVMLNALRLSTRAAAMGDGVTVNEVRFREKFRALMGREALALLEEIPDFCEREFQQAKAVTDPRPALAQRAVAAAHRVSGHVVLSTNAVFPKAGIAGRLKWLGLSFSDFELVTTYEFMHYCKPDPRYFLETASLAGVEPERVLVIGNDVREDAQCCTAAGMEVFLITDCMLTRGEDETPFCRGTYEETVEMLEAWI